MNLKMIVGILIVEFLVFNLNSVECRGQSSQSYRLRQGGIANTGGPMSSTSYTLKESALGIFTSDAASSASYRLNGALIITEVEDPDKIVGIPLPKEFLLMQNYPNPFNPQTNIEYALPNPARVMITIYNALGQEVRNLNRGWEEAGYYIVQWDGKNGQGTQQPSGLYIYRIVAGTFIHERKMILLK